MGKQVLILNGSPRKKGNTAALADAFSRGAQNAGHTVIRCDVAHMDIHPCIGCLGGGKDKSSPCVQKDDMERIYQAYRNADVVVLASPLYYWNFSAQLKAAIDRLFAVVEADGMDLPRKECAMLIAAEEDSEENFAPVVSYYGTLLGRLNWEDRGVVLAGGVLAVGDIAGKPSLAQAEKLGEAL